MNITKFKLLNNGYNGIEYYFNDIIPGKKVSIKEPTKKIRRVPIDTATRVYLDQLKYAFLNCSGHWVGPYDKYFDKETWQIMPMPMTGDAPKSQEMLKILLNKINIVFVEDLGASFKIKAECEFIAGKPKTYEIGPIDEEDDFGFYIETFEIINNLMDSIADFLKSYELPATEAKIYLEHTSKLTENEISDLTEDELIERAIELLDKKGAIVLFDEGAPAAITDGQEAAAEVEVKNTNGNSIDSNRIGDESEQEEDDEAEKESVESEYRTEESLDAEVEKDNEEDLPQGNNTPINQEPDKINPYGPPAAASEVEFPLAPEENASNQPDDDIPMIESTPIDEVPKEIDDEIASW